MLGRRERYGSHDLDQVGVTLEKRNSGYFVAGIAQKAGKATVNGLQVGNKLIQVDDVRVSDAQPRRYIWSVAWRTWFSSTAHN